MGRPHRLAAVALVAAVVGLSGTIPAAAQAADDAHTYRGAGYSTDYQRSPTGSVNQSKLWFHADAWWALMLDPTGKTVRVYELMPDHTWRPTTAVVNADVGDIGDAVQDGDTVHVVTRSSDYSLYYERLTFDPAARDYRVDPARLITTRKSAAPPTIAVTASGVLWIAYATAVNVVASASVDGGLTWGQIVTLSNNPAGQVPEMADLVAFDDKVGIMWSDQATGTFHFSWHRNGEPWVFWTPEVAHAGPGEVGATLSLTRVPGPAGDTVAAVVRTTHDQQGPADAPLLEVLVRAPDGTWSMAPVSTVADGLDDPALVVDLATRTLRVFATRNGAVVTKTASLDGPLAFPPGAGELFVKSTGNTLIDPTVGRDPADAGSGVVVLANVRDTASYRHAELPLATAAPAPVPGDATPPSAPAELHGRALDPESSVLSWSAATDGTRWMPGRTGVPVASYVVLRNGKEVATDVTDTSYQDRVRAAAAAANPTRVEYSVVAVDADGNRSTAVTTAVELPGSKQSPVPGYVALALLGLAVVVTVGFLVYRYRVARSARIPGVPQSEPDRTRPRAPVA